MGGPIRAIGNHEIDSDCCLNVPDGVYFAVINTELERYGWVLLMFFGDYLSFLGNIRGVNG